MKIVLIFEGQTEQAFLEPLREFLRPRLARMPVLDPFTLKGHLPIGPELKKVVENLLSAGPTPADAVIALTDVHTGKNPPLFEHAADAKAKMRLWVGANDKFFPHAAQYEFEAWLLPFWPEIQVIARHKLAAPGPSPENVRRPSLKIKEIFRAGNCRDDYKKTRDALRILRGKDLTIAANQCPELKSFLNTILSLCGGDVLP